MELKDLIKEMGEKLKDPGTRQGYVANVATLLMDAQDSVVDFDFHRPELRNSVAEAILKKIFD